MNVKLYIFYDKRDLYFFYLYFFIINIYGIKFGVNRFANQLD